MDTSLWPPILDNQRIVRTAEILYGMTLLSLQLWIEELTYPLPPRKHQAPIHPTEVNEIWEY